MLNKIFNLKNLIWFCAIGLAAFSGYYSVFGIAKLFSGGSWSIIGMAAMLELSKLVVVTFLHDHFKSLRLLFKGYLISAAIVLMAITSIGVYGYLTNSYQETAKVVYKAQNEMILLDQKKALFIQQKGQIDKLVEEKNGRLKSLDNIRVSQQTAYTEQLTQKKGTSGLSRSMSSVDKSSESLNNELSQLTQKSFALSDSIATIDATKLAVSNETFSSELGPLLYLSRITGIPMDIVVNWFILILVIVFDPLAVSLVIAANHLKDKEKINQALDNLTEESEELGFYEEPVPAETTTEEPNGDELVEETETPILEDVNEEIEHLDVVTISEKKEKVEPVKETKKLKKRKKRLPNIKKNSILESEPITITDEEQRAFYEEQKKPISYNNAQRTNTGYRRGITL